MVNKRSKEDKKGTKDWSKLCDGVADPQVAKHWPALISRLLLCVSRHNFEKWDDKKRQKHLKMEIKKWAKAAWPKYGTLKGGFNAIESLLLRPKLGNRSSLLEMAANTQFKRPESYLFLDGLSERHKDIDSGEFAFTAWLVKSDETRAYGSVLGAYAQCDLPAKVPQIKDPLAVLDRFIADACEGR